MSGEALQREAADLDREKVLQINTLGYTGGNYPELISQLLSSGYTLVVELHA
jgi:hypothetical protein